MKRAFFIGSYTFLLATWTVAAHALLVAGAEQRDANVLGTIRLTQAVMANGQRLPEGTYQVRLTGDQPTPAVGETPGGERWVEFLKNRTVAGRELATVVPADDIKTIAKGPAPKANTSRVDVLKGGDYIRVWINSGGTNYLINLPPAQ
jgi:hypothetical protein